MYNGEVSVHSLLCDQIIECWECSCYDTKYLNSSQSVLYTYIASYICMLSYSPSSSPFQGNICRYCCEGGVQFI